ncbi:MAG: radical SAM protein, partial [Thermodesulfobacteriota bacterium]
MKPLIIPVFIPHEGCPHRCVFCEQRTITAQKEKRIGPDHVASVLKQATASERFDVNRKPEVAFYGGTFTGLQKRQMVRLLKAVEPFMDPGLI